MSDPHVEPFSLRLARPDELPKLVAIDDEASELYAHAGLEVALAKDHPFVVAESVRWTRAIARSLADVAVDSQDQPMGFMTLGFVDGEPSKPGGVGELGSPSVAPAIANALFSLTGVRQRSTPLTLG